MNTHEHAMILPASPDSFAALPLILSIAISFLVSWDGRSFAGGRSSSLCVLILFLGGLLQVAQTFPLQQGYFQVSVYTTCPEFFYSPPPLLTPHSS